VRSHHRQDWGVDEPADAHGRRQRGGASGDVNGVLLGHRSSVDNRGATAPRLICSQLEGVAFNGCLRRRPYEGGSSGGGGGE
jgi:hypothetical protein